MAAGSVRSSAQRVSSLSLDTVGKSGLSSSASEILDPRSSLDAYGSGEMGRHASFGYPPPTSSVGDRDEDLGSLGFLGAPAVGSSSNTQDPGSQPVNEFPPSMQILLALLFAATVVLLIVCIAFTCRPDSPLARAPSCCQFLCCRGVGKAGG
ncbi:unnamed protein product [Protopolystoma xenopodis]|uniref:Uncharacterized protein n=1 Tax=Protopolystoma xenopodis TaxID=117903 RepID=A0A3S5BN71_9PLAT|nr:unnamed protein product [Protopolystoma xenopodis]